MAGSLFNQDSQTPLSEINITPFVDVVLVLLIIFMVTAPMLESGISIQLPKTTAKSLPKEAGEPTPVLFLTQDSRIFLDKQELTFETLETRIAEYYRRRNKRDIYIKADSQLPYGLVAQAMAYVKNAGIHKISLVTIPEGLKKK